MQELCDIKDLFFAACGVECQGHQFEMVFGLAEVSALLGIAFGVEAVRAIATCRPVPEFHHHAHGRGGTAGIDVATATGRVGRTLAVPRIVLVPEGLAERLHHSTGLTSAVEAARRVHRTPFGHDVGRGAEVVVAHVLDLLAESVEGVLEALGHIIRGILTRGGVGKNRSYAVVGGHDDEAFAVADVEDIIVGGVTVGSDADQVQLDVGVLLGDSGGAQEFGTDFLGLLLVDRGGHEAAE